MPCVSGRNAPLAPVARGRRSRLSSYIEMMVVCHLGEAMGSNRSVLARAVLLTPPAFLPYNSHESKQPNGGDQPNEAEDHLLLRLAEH